MGSNDCNKCGKSIPPLPYLQPNFQWEGRYRVPDLNIDVPFTWNANNGNTQMIAGGYDYPIYFTNLIYEGYLYTYTYKWPGLLPPQEVCQRLFRFSLTDLNSLFATSQYVGPEILEGKTNWHVHHFRLSVVIPNLPPGAHFRIPVASADIYVDRKDSSKFVKVLHFGFQNLFDPQLDEWIIIDKFSNCPGDVILPPECNQAEGA